MVAHTSNPNTWENNTDGLLWVQGQLELQGETFMRQERIIENKQKSSCPPGVNMQQGPTELTTSGTSYVREVEIKMNEPGSKKVEISGLHPRMGTRKQY